MPMKRRPSSRAAAPVVNVPPKAIKNQIPCFEQRLTILCSSAYGFAWNEAFAIFVFQAPLAAAKPKTPYAAELLSRREGSRLSLTASRFISLPVL